MTVEQLVAVVGALILVCGFLGSVAAAGWRAGTWLQKVWLAVEGFGVKLAELGAEVRLLVDADRERQAEVAELGARVEALEVLVAELAGRRDGQAGGAGHRFFPGG